MYLLYFCVFHPFCVISEVAGPSFCVITEVAGPSLMYLLYFYVFSSMGGKIIESLNLCIMKGGRVRFGS
ncbi:hypothetical protein HanRHA438_Chr16g0766751 [Helianthus annuus]|nr:hypothetical protein HanRHA438_Chr16g0766751 [Helianthus annuus]